MVPMHDKSSYFRIIPPGATSTYDLQILDADGDVIADRLQIVGNFSEKLDIPLACLKTVNIKNASPDGTYKCKIHLLK